MRQGDYRIIYRPLTGEEIEKLGAAEQAGFLVERVIDRGELERAAAGLPAAPHASP